MNYNYNRFWFSEGPKKLSNPKLNEQSVWLYRGRHLVTLASLGIGYFLYRRLLFYTMLNNNEILSQQQAQQLALKNFTMKGANMLLGHHINMQQNYSLKKQRIIVVGAGQTGLAASKKLLARGYEVILIDQNEFKPPSFELEQPKVSLLGLLTSMLNLNSQIKTQWNFLLEPYVSLYLINKLFFRNEIETDQTLSQTEFKQLKLDIPQLQSEYPILQLDGQIKEIKNEEELLKVSTCRNQQNGFTMEQLIESYCQTNFPGTFHQLTKCCADKFVFDHQGQAIGVLTNVGFIKGDKILITGGYYSKTIVSKLGYRLPLIAYRSCRLENEKPLENVLQNHIVETPNIITYRLNNNHYIQTHPKISGASEKDQERDAKKLIEEFSSLSNSQLEDKTYDWQILARTITPDGQPIVQNVPGFSNIYLNLGNRDLSHLASAQIITDLMEEEQENQFSFQRFYLV